MNQTHIKNINIKRICVLRLSAIGDVLMALPAITAIQKKYPQAKITWVVNSLEAELLKNISGLEIIVFDKKNGFKELFVLRKKLKNYVFDVLLHMQPTLRANLVSLVIKAKIKLGFNQSKEGQFLFVNQKLPKVKNNNIHFVDGFMQFAKELDCDDVVSFPNLLTDKDEVFAKQYINNKTLVINTCASGSFVYRNWHKDNFVKLLNKIPQNIPIVLVGGKTQFEQETNQYICENTSNVLNLTGKTDLIQLVAIIKQAKVLLSVDSAPVHIADMVKTPVISLFGATNPKQTGSYFYPQHCISSYPKIKKWGKRFKSTKFMESITVNLVHQKIIQFY
ncbi:ADP-heptose--lipooligosaccharide heptosyltransferase II [hydrothermal vent metagenome]|uniref:ADP-heptose--lipooligosaccharide heptosyltransferase II n=1 Tax=hydrothermal vent metagenome TaxID=652676 RepID=A0A1W1CRB7_9ZZZZ